MVDHKSNFEDWLVAKLESFSLDTEVYAGYVTGLLQDEEGAVEDTAQTVMDILSGAAEEAIPDSFKGELVEEWERKLREEKETREKEEQERKILQQKLLEKDLKESEEALLAKKLESDNRKARSSAELQQRERLLNEYGFNVISNFDEDGNLVYSEEKEEEDGEGLGLNQNRAIGAAVFKAQREASKAAHDKEVQRNKELKLKEQLRKERAKQRTMKKEKRRGAG